MIKINLLKDAVRKRPARKKAAPRGVLYALAGVGAAAALAVAAFGLWRYIENNRVPEALTVNEDLSPSTFTKSNVVEEVVRDVRDRDKLDQSGVLQLPYAELTFAEKVNYEIQFARDVFAFLGAAAPAGIEFKRFEASEFQTLYGSGISKSRDLIAGMLLSFRENGAEILPRPYTKIVRKDEAYQFAVTAEKHFGLDLAAPFVDLGLGQLAGAEDIENQVAALKRIASQSGVSLVQNPQALESRDAGAARRFRFALTATSSYNAFVAFVDALYDQRVPCAFETITLTALTSEKVKVDARLFFTVLN